MMRRMLACFAPLAMVATSAHSVVIRHDVADSRYLVEDGPASMIDMPHEGHGMLIAPQWVVTAAHVVFYDYKGKMIAIGGADYEIEYVIFHEGYARPADGLFAGDSARSQAYLQGNHDIALLKLKDPVVGVQPIPLCRGTDEAGEIVTFFGKGNTGDGLAGEQDDTRGVLRRAQNRITDAADQWIAYHFDQGEDALPLEGMQGSGDSGGPALIIADGEDCLAGLASWDIYQGDLTDFKAGVYGLGAKLVRLSYYSDWIAGVQTWSDAELAVKHNRTRFHED